MKSLKEQGRKLLESFNRLGARQRMLILFLIASIILSLYYNMVHKPQTAALRKLKGKYTAIDNQLKKLKIKMPDIEKEEAELAKAKRSYDGLKLSLARLEKGLPAQAYVPQFLGELIRQARGLNIDFVSIKTQNKDKDKEKKIYASLDIQMQFNAKYASMVNYLRRLEHTPQFLNTVSVLMEEMKDDSLRESRVTLDLATLLAEKDKGVVELPEAALLEQVSVKRSPFISKFKPGTGADKKELYKVTGITYNGEESTVIINDTVCRTGDTIADMQVKEILPDSVMLASGNESILLTIE